MNLFQFLRSLAAELFGRYDYRKHQCEAMRQVGKGAFACCVRRRGHWGFHRDDSNFNFYR